MLDREVVERLGELLAKATPGPWTVHEDSGDMEVLSGNRTVCDDTAYYPHAVDQNDMRLISAAVNALPELLRVYRAWLDAPVVDVWGGYDEYGITFRADSEAGELAAFQDSGLAGQSIRLVRDGDSGEGES